MAKLLTYNEMYNLDELIKVKIDDYKEFYFPTDWYRLIQAIIRKELEIELSKIDNNS